MKFSIEKKVFADYLKMVAGIAPPASAIPILFCVRLEAREEKIHIAASDLEMGIRISCAAQMSEPGGICLPARLLSDIVASAVGETLSLEGDEKNTVEILSGQTKTVLRGLLVDDFPAMEDISGAQEWTLPTAHICGMIRSVYYAVGVDEACSALNGAYLSCNGGNLKLVATDGRRMAIKSESGSSAVDVGAGVIIHRRALAEIVKILEKRDNAEVSLGQAGSMFFLRLTQENILFTSRLIEEKFPDYQRAVPEGYENTIIVDRAKLVAALRRMRIIINKEYPEVSVSFLEKNPGNNIMRLYGQNADIGHIEEDIAISQVATHPDTVSFNVFYLISALEPISSDLVALDFRQNDGPLKILSAEDYERFLKEGLPPEYLAVVMPIRT